MENAYKLGRFSVVVVDHFGHLCLYFSVKVEILQHMCSYLGDIITTKKFVCFNDINISGVFMFDKTLSSIKMVTAASIQVLIFLGTIVYVDSFLLNPPCMDTIEWFTIFLYIKFPN